MVACVTVWVMKRGYMEKYSKYKKFEGRSKDKSDIEETIFKMQKQMNRIEEKLDSILDHSPKSSKGFSLHHGGDSSRRGYGPIERTYTKAVCSQCKNECELPFKPTGDRPVFCSECFAKNQKENSSYPASRDTRGEERSFSRERRPEKRRSTITKRKPSFAGKKTSGKPGRKTGKKIIRKKRS